MKGLFKWAALIVVAFIGIGVIGSMGDDEEPAARASSTATAERETPEATERETPEPTRRPTPEPVSNAGWMEFLAHGLEYADSFVADSEALTAAANDFDMEGVTDASIEMWVNLGEEVRWLDDHPPDPCFADAHAAYRHAISSYHHALDVLSDGAIASDFDLITEGTELMEEATEYLNEARVVMEGTVCG